MSLTIVCGRVRELVAEIEDFVAVYGPDMDDEHALPGGLPDFPCAVVYPGQTTLYRQDASAASSHEYELELSLFGGPVGEAGLAAFTLLPLLDLVIAKFDLNVTLGDRATYARFVRQGGFQTLTWGGHDYLGYKVVLAVVDTALTTFRTGS